MGELPTPRAERDTAHKLAYAVVERPCFDRVELDGAPALGAVQDFDSGYLPDAVREVPAEGQLCVSHVFFARG